MCGIAGVFLKPGGQIDNTVLERMTSRLAHRGPDGNGTWLSPDRLTGLGHRRLSILDLSDLGAQPMISPSSRYVMTYNGELYNFLDLRNVLEREAGVRFRGHSDTEVMLAAFDRWGVDKALPRFSGMFAFAVWDQQRELLQLARDRIGIKPLYYTLSDRGFVFASELRAISSFLGGAPDLSADGLATYLRYGYIPGTMSIFSGVDKVMPGTIVTVTRDLRVRQDEYWNVAQVAVAGMAAPFVGSEEESVQALHDRLVDSVRRHMVSDVPIGCFLSGGIDSSTVTALMQRESTAPIKTFSIGFRESGYDEAHYAAAVARHLQTDHTELYVSDHEARDVIPMLPQIYDEPFADVSQIPTYLVSKLARSKVTVALSGDGGDELFAGYNRYIFVTRFWSRLRLMPRWMRCNIASILRRIPVTQWDRVFSTLKIVAPWVTWPALPGQKAHKIAALLNSPSVESLLSSMVAQWPNPGSLLMARFARDGAVDPVRDALISEPIARQILWDMKAYLPDDILTKVDRASMHVGLEVRVPLLDHNVVEFAWSLPLSLKLRNGQGKWILRRVLERYVPRALFERPKMGFSVPIDAWLRGPLRDWAESYLSVARLQEDDLFNPAPIRQAWEQHLSGRIDRGTALWVVLMFQVWRERVRLWA